MIMGVKLRGSFGFRMSPVFDRCIERILSRAFRLLSTGFFYYKVI